MQNVALVCGGDDGRVIEMESGEMQRAGWQNRRRWCGKKLVGWLVRYCARSHLQSKGEQWALWLNGRGDTASPLCLGLVTKR